MCKMKKDLIDMYLCGLPLDQWCNFECISKLNYLEIALLVHSIRDKDAKLAESLTKMLKDTADALEINEQRRSMRVEAVLNSSLIGNPKEKDKDKDEERKQIPLGDNKGLTGLNRVSTKSLIKPGKHGSNKRNITEEAKNELEARQKMSSNIIKNLKRLKNSAKLTIIIGLIQI